MDASKFDSKRDRIVTTLSTMASKEMAAVFADSPESRRYNRIKRWLGVGDFVIGFGLLVVLLVTGWTGTLRDLAERGASQNYVAAVFLYVLMLMLTSKVIGIPLEYYGFRLEHRWAGWDRSPFTADSASQVAVYQKNQDR